MRAVRIHKFGDGPQDLVYEENVMQPRPKVGEVLVKVYATGVTPNEINWIWYHPLGLAQIQNLSKAQVK
jgi:NADPH:quinone reductase-like Zn-dependent oxidoreductase